MAELLPRGPKVRIIFLAVYSILWIVTDIAADLYASGTGLEVWYVGAALDVVLFLIFGWGWWPLPVVLYGISFLIMPAERYGPLYVNVIAQAPYELILALATKLTVDVFDIQFPIRTVRHIIAFSAALGLAGAVIANAAFVATFSVLNPSAFPWSTFGAELLSNATADVTSIIVLVPFITQLLAWKQPLLPEEPESEAKFGSLFFAGLTIAAVVAIVENVVAARIGRPLGEFSLVPLALMSITFGMRGAVVALFVVDSAASLTRFLLHTPIESMLSAQGYFITTSFLAMLLGAITTDRLGLHSRLTRAANNDALTGLPNARRLSEWLQSARADSMSAAIIDIAALRLLNEGVGREAVDRLLVDLSARFRGLPDAYFVARVGSGEFAVTTLNDDPHSLINRVQRLFDDAFPVHGANVFIEPFIGAATIRAPEAPRELLRRADLAVRRARDAASQSAVYAPDAEPSSAPLLVVELHNAAERGEFVPFFQPIYSYHAGTWRLAGAEVLMRWDHPRRGLLTPADFLPLLEKLSICGTVGWKILEESLKHAMIWRSTLPEFSVWVNFFPRQIFDPKCVDRVLSAIARADAVPEALVIEIMETIAATDDFDVATLVQRLRAAGVRTAIDDFGTGGSSLARIREVPAHFLKIDRSFVTRSDLDPKALSVAKAVVRLAQELGMRPLAEGVENTPQIGAMLTIGCEYAQGFALGHPVPAALFDQVINESKTA